MNQVLDKGLRAARRTVVAVVGGTVVATGIVLIVLPGPAMVVIPIGLAILGSEFVWARRLLRKMKNTVGNAAENLLQGKTRGKDEKKP
jgi:uncharacterized protein (TIGR02611 family)